MDDELISRAEEILEHSGVKGMRWGVRKKVDKIKSNEKNRRIKVNEKHLKDLNDSLKIAKKEKNSQDIIDYTTQIKGLEKHLRSQQMPGPGVSIAKQKKNHTKAKVLVGGLLVAAGGVALYKVSKKAKMQKEAQKLLKEKLSHNYRWRTSPNEPWRYSIPRTSWKEATAGFENQKGIPRFRKR